MKTFIFMPLGTTFPKVIEKRRKILEMPPQMASRHGVTNEPLNNAAFPRCKIMEKR